jgi:hypothetical protein
MGPGAVQNQQQPKCGHPAYGSTRQRWGRCNAAQVPSGCMS